MQEFSALLLAGDFEGMGREAERGFIQVGQPPLDFRTVPRTEWGNHLHRDVTLLPAVERYLLTHPDGPLTERQVHDIEDETTWWHKISAPYYLSMSLISADRPDLAV